MSFPDDLLALARAIRPQMVAGTSFDGVDTGLAALANRHGVTGLYAAAVGDVDTVRSAIARSLVQLAASARIDAAFSGLPHLFLKGLAVGALAYEQPLLKQASDIDLLVLPADLQESTERLQRSGFSRIVPPAPVGLAAWQRVSNQSVWTDPSGQVVELHDRCVSVPGLLAELGAESPAQRLPVADGITLPTFDAASTFSYLAVHGATSAWFRLKWVADFAGFCLRHPDLIEPWFDGIADSRVRSAAACALLLANGLFVLPLSARLSQRIHSDRRAIKMAIGARSMLTGGEPTERLLGTLPIHRTVARLAGASALPRLASDLVRRRLLAG